MTARWVNEFPNEDKLMMALLPPPPPAAVRDVVMGEFSTGGDSGGEFNPALQVVVLLSVRSPASQTISQSISYFLLIRLLSVGCRVSLRLIWSFHPSSGRLPTIKREKKEITHLGFDVEIAGRFRRRSGGWRSSAFFCIARTLMAFFTVVGWGSLLLSQSFLFPEFRPSILKPNLRRQEIEFIY